jgi:thiamine-monophosphate kinase
MTVSREGERAVIERIARRFAKLAPPGKRPILGPGDDAALLDLPAGRVWAATSDLLLEGVHFRREWTPPRLLGHKALAVNLSDLAAMGAEPESFLLNLGLPPAWPLASLDAFLDGMAGLAGRAGIALAGGDTCAGERLQIGITAVGSVEERLAIRRSGGRPGDRLLVSGPLGGARAGLRLLEAGWRLEGDRAVPPTSRGPVSRLPPAAAGSLLVAHLAPDPELILGRTLAGKVTAGIDLSDGLSQDLHNLCSSSGCGALLDERWIPVETATLDVFKALGEDPLAAAVAGGEEYRLLVSVPDARAGDLSRTAGLREIGRLTAPEEGIRITGQGGERPLERSGFEHFPDP